MSPSAVEMQVKMTMQFPVFSLLWDQAPGLVQVTMHSTMELFLTGFL